MKVEVGQYWRYRNPQGNSTIWRVVPEEEGEDKVDRLLTPKVDREDMYIQLVWVETGNTIILEVLDYLPYRAKSLEKFDWELIDDEDIPLYLLAAV